MDRITLGDLRKGDVVTMECQVQRYHVPAPAKGTVKPNWDNWRASFQLDSVTLLWRPPPFAPKEKESDAETVAREDTDEEFEGF